MRAYLTFARNKSRARLKSTPTGRSLKAKNETGKQRRNPRAGQSKLPLADA
jgi:hypothetical protein